MMIRCPNCGNENQRKFVVRGFDRDTGEEKYKCLTCGSKTFKVKIDV